ncbi:unnamed protein product, partial [Discosporangium mesarthrocarpum]
MIRSLGMLRNCQLRSAQLAQTLPPLRAAANRQIHEDRCVVGSSFGMNDHTIQVYGANTEVGKTVISAGLCRAATSQGFQASYIKPVQTGDVSDAVFVSRHAPTCRTKSLFNFTDPVSPHLAAARDSAPTSDLDVLSAVIAEIEHVLERGPRNEGATPTDGDCVGTLTLVETAGGVLSPAPSGSLQADVFRPMRLPVLLVGDGRLGGIGATLSALESLRVRGYTVLGIALLGQEADLGNMGAISHHSGDIPVFELGALPPPDVALEPWYEAQGAAFDSALRVLVRARAALGQELATSAERALESVWWPFTQHSGLGEGAVTVLDSAYGDCYNTVTIEREGREEGK